MQEDRKRSHDELQEVKRRRTKKQDHLSWSAEGPREEAHSSYQWMLHRECNPGDSIGTGRSSMVLMEHLGDTSEMVESLTHQLDSWSLVSNKQTLSTNAKIKKERAKASRREIMKALLKADVKADLNDFAT